tara:strand:- start:266 stop:649 length:384 start_codon:yes stop_codon:yes gene_type:complete
MIFFIGVIIIMNLENIDNLPEDISNLIYSKIIYNQPKELLTDIRNFTLSKNRLKQMNVNDIVCNLLYIDYINAIKLPKIIKTEKYNKHYHDNKIMMINLSLAKNTIDIRNKIVYDILQYKMSQFIDE